MAAAMGQAGTQEASRRGSGVRWVQHRIRPEQIRELSLLFLIIVAILVFGSLIDGYYTSRTFNRVASSVAIITVVAVGQTLVVLTRSIDLSVGSIVGCTAYFVGTQMAAHPELSPALAVLVALALGAALGVINGVIVAWGRVPSIIATLGTLAIYRGLLIEYSDANTVTTDSLPAWIVELPRLTLFTLGGLEVRAMVALALVIVGVSHFATGYLNFGRRFYAIGSNPDAAELAGLPTRRIVFTAFLMSGALAGLAGFMTLARFGNMTVENGIGLELQVVAAVVVGGVNIFGGSGTVVGAMLGAVMIGTLEQSLFRLQISQFWLDALLGLLILLAVASDTLILRRLRALWARTELRLAAEASREADSVPRQRPV
jgi:rhamnose transport system permease protein